MSIVLYCAGLFTIKMTFLFQYYRVFAVQNLRKLFIAAIVIVGAWGISQVLVGIFICTPIAGFWDSNVAATCIPNLPQWYANAAGNILTDIAVLVMPFPLLKRLNLPKQQKVLLFGIFGLGFFTVAISVLRIKYLKLFEDFTWENVNSSAWSIGELCSGITCACLPTLGPFMKAHFPGMGSQLADGYHDYVNDEEAAAAAVVLKRGGSSVSVYPSASESVSRRPSGPMGSGESGESTENIIGLESRRQEITQSGNNGGDGIGEEDRGGRLGLRTTIESRAKGRNRNAASRSPQPAPGSHGIQVQRVVMYQVNRQRGD